MRRKKQRGQKHMFNISRLDRPQYILHFTAVNIICETVFLNFILNLEFKNTEFQILCASKGAVQIYSILHMIYSGLHRLNWM